MALDTVTGRANKIGSAWMIFAMAAFAIEDTLIKTITVVLPVGQALVLFGVGGAAVFAGVVCLRKERLFNADVVSRVMRVRVVFEIMGRLFYVLALALTPLSSATAILQATPIVVVLGAAVFFGEKVGWLRWFAIIVGLVGVLIIIRPAADNFSMVSLLAVLGMLGFAGRDLASRAAPLSLSTSHLGFYGFLAVIAAGLMFSVWDVAVFVPLDRWTMLLLVCAAIWGAGAYAGLMKAMRTGEVATVTPFRYTRLLFGIGLGVLLFNEQLDWVMLMGCGIVVVSGLLILGQRNGRVV